MPVSLRQPLGAPLRLRRRVAAGCCSCFFFFFHLFHPIHFQFGFGSLGPWSFLLLPPIGPLGPFEVPDPDPQVVGGAGSGSESGGTPGHPTGGGSRAFPLWKKAASKAAPIAA